MSGTAVAAEVAHDWDLDSTLACETRRIMSDYAEMPGLCLTRDQARRLFGLEADTCDRLLQALVRGGFLRVGPRGFVRA
jgi:hypothetical protein